MSNDKSTNATNQNYSGAYGSLIVQDHSILVNEKSHLEDAKSSISNNDMQFNLKKQMAVKPHINTPGFKQPLGTNLPNKYNLFNAKNPEIFYEDDILLNVNNENNKNSIVVNEVKQNFLDKARKINQNFHDANANSKKAGDYFYEKYNISKNLNDEFFNSSNFINLDKKSPYKPPKLFNNNNIPTLKTPQGTEVSNTLPDRTPLETYKDDEKDNFFNIVPDNSILNISAIDNDIILNKTKNDRSANNSFISNNKIKLPAALSSNHENLHLASTSTNNLHQPKNYIILKNDNYDIHHDSIIRDLDHSIIEKNLNMVQNYPQNTRALIIPEADIFENTIFLEDLKKTPEPEVPIVSASPLQVIEPVVEPQKFEESIYEETILEDDKAKFAEFRNVAPEIKPEVNDKENKMGSSLYDLYGKGVIQSWCDISKNEKLQKIKQGIQTDKYFNHAFLSDDGIIDFTKFPSRTFIKNLENAYLDQLKQLGEESDKKDFWEINDVFILEEQEKAVVSNRGSNNKSFLDQRKALKEKLIKKQKRSIYNRISFIYDSEVLEQKYFISNEKIVTSDHSKVLGQSTDLKDFLHKESQIQGKENFGNTKNYKIDLWRDSISDGNSFFRMFMFTYLENLIINNKLQEIALIFKNIHHVYLNLVESNKAKNLESEKFIFNKIKIINVLIVFNLIINCMRAKDFADAYRILVNAFNEEDPSFDKILIGYLRLSILDYINWIEKKDNAFKTEQKVEFIKKNLLFKNFTFGYIEPEKIIVDLAARLFETKILLFSLDGSINLENTNNKFTATKTLFNGDNCASETPTLCLFYCLNKFSNFYSAENYALNKEIYRSYASNIKEIVFEEKTSSCTICRIKESTKKIYFKKELIVACIDCIKEKTEEKLNKRFQYFQKDCFISREYYCRDLNIDDQITITDYLYTHLFKKNIWNDIMQRLKTVCSRCLKKENKLYSHKNCWNYCESCLTEMINTSTDNKIILNSFENRQIIKNNPQLLELRNTFDLKEALETLHLNTPEKAAEAEERFKNTCETLCCKCIKNKKVSKDQPNNSAIIEFRTLKINNDNSPNIPNEHLICSSCVENYVQTHMNNNNLNEPINANINNLIQSKNALIPANIEISFKCEICDIEHCTIINLAPSKPNINNNKKACCAGGCSIF